MSASNWQQTFEGKHSRETWTHASGAVQVVDRTAAWDRNTARPYYVSLRTPSGHWVSARYRGLGLYKTAEGAMKAAESAIADGRLEA